MANLDEAARRVEAAMDRLERAVAARVAEPPVAEQWEAVEELRRELEAAREENTRLRTAKGDIEQRLDAAIARLRSVLEA